MASRENSLTVRMRAARFTVRPTVRRSCARRGGGEVFRMFEKADVVHGHDDGNAGQQGSGVLNVDQVRGVGADQTREFPAEAGIGIGGDVAHLKALGNPALGAEFGDDRR